MTILAADTLTGRAYVRCSSNNDQSVEGQLDDIGLACAERGVMLSAERYEDNDRSASIHATKAREGYDQLIGDLTNGRFTDQLLIITDSSRGSRRVGEWVLLIDLLAEQGKRVFVVDDEQIYDPTNGNDRHHLVGNANNAEKFIWELKQKTGRGMAKAAKKGKMHGGQSNYGLRKVYDSDTGKLIGTERVEDEARVIEELFQRVRAKETIASISRDFERRGIRSRSGKVFTQQTLRKMLTRPAYTALRKYKDEEYEGNWPAIIDRETWRAVQDIISSPGRGSSKNAGKLTHEFTGGAVKCDVCGSGLTLSYNRKDTGEYRCAGKGCVSGIDKLELDDKLETVILAYLSDPHRGEQLTRETDDTEASSLRAEIARLDGERRALADDMDISVEFAKRRDVRITERVKAAEARLRELSTPSALRDLVGPGEDVARRWAAASVPAKREVAALLFTPAILGEARITRKHARNVIVPIEDRIIFRREQD
ncbi:DNA invertase Pin-like site-specific DNA recombinase [Haloactinopolyspora alba]|uniref:DNA invertase Pin-like site-specific DNA recombinase n=1 Tax=Haloactinopolyspora alba TaxID=648780 RepID=A0A2P8DWG4_9ACTN|nr:recombinase family protein [Haloactinopolyspora alba]PSL01563.1 DNA invertase Pin-like site-specific DNA recombinase [Haloactinopolyspora alba]